MNTPRFFRLFPGALLASASLLAGPSASADPSVPHAGESIAPAMEAVYVRGLNFLKTSQAESGMWNGQMGNDPAVVGVAVLAILAHGEDPNHGPYAQTVRRGVDYILKQRNSKGQIGNSMYSHGFGTLALAECYGHVQDDRIGPALKKAVDLLITSQNQNPKGGWRYSIDAKDADTSVSTAQMVALFAAANAGLEVPEKNIQRGLAYLKSCQAADGSLGYTGAEGGSATRAAFGALCYALAKRRDDPVCRAALKYLAKASDSQFGSYMMYHEYYVSQALFQGDMEQWKKWSDQNFSQLKASQSPNGSWEGDQGPIFSTAGALLSIAVHYRLKPIYER